MKRFRINSAPSIVLIMLCIMYFITYLDRVNVSTAAAGFGKGRNSGSLADFRWIPGVSDMSCALR